MAVCRGIPALGSTGVAPARNLVPAEALGHSDTRMAEKHYAHLAPSYVADTIRRTAPDLALPDVNVMVHPGR